MLGFGAVIRLQGFTENCVVEGHLLYEFKDVEGDRFSQCCGTQWAWGYFSMTLDSCFWNECLDLRC